jgi:hypothetical protein
MNLKNLTFLKKLKNIRNSIIDNYFPFIDYFLFYLQKKL